MDLEQKAKDIAAKAVSINDQRKAEIKGLIRDFIIEFTQEFTENEMGLSSDITQAGLHSQGAAFIAAQIETEFNERLASCSRPAIVHGLALYGLNVVITELIEEFTAGQGDSHA